MTGLPGLLADAPRGGGGWIGDKNVPLLKICHTSTMMKLGTMILYLKTIQKIYKWHYIPLVFCWHQRCIFHRKCYIKKYRYRLHFNAYFSILLTLFASLKVVLINMIAILMMSAKLATLDLLKIKVFWDKVYDITISVHYVTNKFLLRDPNYTIDVVMWPKFDNSSISMREVIVTSVLWGYDQKKQFFWGMLLVQVQ